jgi:hypothetical protein
MNVSSFSITRRTSRVVVDEQTVDAKSLTLAELFQIIDTRLAVGDLVSRDIANVLGVLKPAAFGAGTATPPVTVIRAALFPQTRVSDAAKSRLAWDFNDGVDLSPKDGDDDVTRKHLKAAARALGMTYKGTSVPYDAKITSA